MKKLKKEPVIKLEEYGVSVNPWLTYAQIQAIVDKVKPLNKWAERQQAIDLCVLAFACGLDVEEVKKLDHTECLQSGLIRAVKLSVSNMWQIEEALNYEESWQKAINELSAIMPDYVKLKEAKSQDATGEK